MIFFRASADFSLGLERTGGFETVAFCERQPFQRHILAKHWPEVEQNDDITTADFEPIGPVDLVTAGFPCQDISLAGKGAGLSGDRSGLFWHILRTVRMVGRPKLLLENVAALLDRGMGSVLGALAEVGYDVQWDCIPASAVGAPHRRDRVWLRANHRSERGQGVFLKEISGQPAFSWCKDVRRAEDLPQRSDLYASQLCRSRDGVSERLDAVGNAVVPQIPELIGRAILESRSAA